MAGAQQTNEPVASQDGPSAHSWLGLIGPGLLTYYTTSLICALGVSFGHDFLKSTPHVLANRPGLINAFTNWDGRHYKEIVEEGYHYEAAKPSNVAFFPAFPLLARWLANLTGMSADMALLLVAHVSLAAAFVGLAAYLQRRFPEMPRLTSYVLVVFGLWPTTMFFRMAYSESLFFLCTILTLYGIERKWPLILIALIVGFATATRSVGVCLLVPLAWHAWQRSSGRWDAIRTLCLVPVACWGITAFMVYQHLEFGDPLAFAQTQQNWRMRPPVPLLTQMRDLAILEPVGAVFDPDSVCCWQRYSGQVSPLFSLQLANSCYWFSGLVLIGIGIWKRWLTNFEWSLALGLLLVPYVLRGHEMCMGSMGRFAAVAFPVYIVLGQILVRLPAGFVAALLALSGFFLGAYAALFAAGYWFW